MNYWKWLIRGSGAGPGFRRFIDLWLLLHGVVAAVLSWVNPSYLVDAARSLLLPLAGLFIGLSFAWGGNAQALLQTEEIKEMTEYHPGGFQEYVFTYQSAILLILITLVLWGLAGLGIFDETWPTPFRQKHYFVVSSVLFLFASLTLRECWHVVLGAHWLLMSRYEIKKERSKKDKK